MLVIILLGATFPLLGATTTPENLPYGIGIQVSPSIWGLSYHQQFGKHAIQGTVGISFVPDPQWESMLTYGVALDYQRTLYGYDYNAYLGSRLYALATLAHTGEIPTDSGVTGPFEAKILIGAGFGVEVLFFKNFSLPIEFAYQFSYSPTQSDMKKAFGLDLVPKLGLRFRFT